MRSLILDETGQLRPTKLGGAESPYVYLDKNSGKVFKVSDIVSNDNVGFDQVNFMLDKQYIGPLGVPTSYEGLIKTADGTRVVMSQPLIQSWANAGDFANMFIRRNLKQAGYIRDGFHYITPNGREIRDIKAANVGKINGNFVIYDPEIISKSWSPKLSFAPKWSEGSGMVGQSYLRDVFANNSEIIGHGLTKGDYFAELDNLLTNGVDKSKPFYSAPLGGKQLVGVDQGLAHADGPFIVIDNGSGRFNQVLVNDIEDPDFAINAIKYLKSKYPNVQFIPYSKTNNLFFGKPDKSLNISEQLPEIKTKITSPAVKLNQDELPPPPEEINLILKQGGILKRVDSGKSGIKIKPENKGKFTETKKRTGKTTEELTHSKNPLTRKRAIFAQNAKKWSKNKK